MAQAVEIAAEDFDATRSASGVFFDVSRQDDMGTKPWAPG